MSCNEDFKGGNRVNPVTQAEETLGAAPQRFSTRLSPTLLIAGEKCRGTETTGSFGNGDICEAGQYLISIDDVNTCSGEICTTNLVTPIVAELFDIDARYPGEAVYEIRAKSVTTQTQEDILETVLVRSDSMGNGRVVSRLP